MHFLPHGIANGLSGRVFLKSEFLKSGTPRGIGKKRFLGSANLTLYKLNFKGFLGLSAQLLNFSFSCFEELPSSSSYLLDFWFGFQALCGCFTPRSCCRRRIVGAGVTSLSSPPGIFPFLGLGKSSPGYRGRHIPLGILVQPIPDVGWQLEEEHPALKDKKSLKSRGGQVTRRNF